MLDGFADEARATCYKDYIGHFARSAFLTMGKGMKNEWQKGRDDDQVTLSENE